MKVGILTASDSSARGEREDRSGKVIREMVEAAGAEVGAYAVVPDDAEEIRSRLVEMTDTLGLDVVLTTGGTGLGPRDVTPEATLSLIEREVPGIPEAMRLEGLKKTPLAALSRAVAGVRGRSLIVNLPGSPTAVRECLGAIMGALGHAVEVIRGEARECARHGT